MKFDRAASRFLFVAVLIIFLSDADGRNESSQRRVNFDEENNRSKEKISTSLRVEDDSTRNKSARIRNVMTSAMKSPEKREQIGQVLPIIRNMSPPQKMAMGTLISSRITSNETSSPNYEELQSFYKNGSRINATRELMLPISMDVARILTDEENSEEELMEELPEAQELRLIRPGRGRRPYYRPQLPPRRTTVNRRNVFPVEGTRLSSKRPSRRPTETKKEPSSEECTFFTKTVCLEATNYPYEAITRSLRGNKEMVSALLTDFKSNDDSENDKDRPSALALENRYENRYESNELKRRADYQSSYENVEEGFTCPSTVMYARPQLARAVSGIWKYIINTGEHTQTLRLEKCSNPKGSCSFISENYRSSCTQVYNYHRLLTWEASLGLHMDIFKVPTCCSCHVHGYTELFPPLQKDPRPAHHENFPGADFATEDQGSDPGEYSERPTSYLTKFKPSASFDTNFLSNPKKPLVDAGTSNRPSFALPGRRKKPTSSPRPFDKLPQQHAPNTRAPGYKGPIMKSKRPSRPSRPYRRESSIDLDDNASSSSASDISNINNWSSQPYDQDMDASSRLHNGGFDEEYQEPNRRVNYNYHPIIDFFKPEASMLQSSEPVSETQSSSTSQQTNSDSWKPMISA